MTNISLINNPLHTIFLAKKNLYRNIGLFYRSNTHKISNITVFFTSFFFTYEILSYLYSINRYLNIYYYIYWFLLGILSTIGFGFGLHTGTFFLIPNILNIYNETTLDGYITTGIKSYVFLKSLPIVISWGIGTAIGELPPYFISRYSKEDYDQMLSSLNLNSKYINYVKNYSFPVITILASWPNMTFDFVGVLCGVNNISVYSFLIPTIIGKAFIKAPIQAFVIIYFYSEISNYIDIKNNNSFYSLINILFFTVMFYFSKNLIETLAKNEEKNNY